MLDLFKNGVQLDQNFLQERLDYFSEVIDNHLVRSVECNVEREEFQFNTMQDLVRSDSILREDLYYPSQEI